MSRSDCTNPTSIVPVQQHKDRTDDDCQQVLAALLVIWPEVPDDDSSSGLLDHLCECRNCRQKWLALEIAADLAVVPAHRRHDM